MSVLVWDEVGSRTYETGVDHGVLYLPDSTNQYVNAYVWNGLTAVSESSEGGEPEALYADNIKYLELVSAEEKGLSISAYTYPPEFEQCDGTAEPVKGLKIGQQTRKKFGFVYRTKVGNDVDGEDHGYKLHLCYGCLAAPTEREYATINDSPEAIEFSWDISCTPVVVNSNYKNAAILTVDSTLFETEAEKAALKALEDALFGTENGSARLPMPAEVITLLTPGTPTTYHTVSFNMGGHGATVPSQRVADGAYATRPADPTAEGWTFGGWYTSDGLTTAFDFDSQIEADTTIYAKWTEAN